MASAPITTPEIFTAAIAAAQVKPFLKASIANSASGFMFSLWKAAGNPPAGSNPTTAATCTSATAGGFPFTNETANYLGHLWAQMAIAGSLIVYDRIQHMGGLSGTVITAQTVNLAIPANRNASPDGSDVEWFIEHYVDTGATGVTATITYTNGSDVGSRTCTVALAATTRASRLMQIIPSTAGDTIKSIQTVTLSATTGTAGNFGVTVAKVLHPIGVSVISQISIFDAFNLGLPVIPDNACLWLVELCSTTSTGVVNGGLKII